MPIAALLPILALALAFVLYCLLDLSRQNSTHYLSKPAWAVITLITVPLGGVLYLLLGRSPSADRADGGLPR